MNKVEMEQKPISMTKAIFRDADTRHWYWIKNAFETPVGPFKTRDDARADFKYVMGQKDD